MSMPEFGSLENNENKAFRTNKATEMSRTFKSPNCVFKFLPNNDQTYAIQNTKNKGYLQSHIQTYFDLKPKTSLGDHQKWRFLPIPDIKNGYYIQNVGNGGYLTKECSKMIPHAGHNEVYIVEARPKPQP
ncbi:hypothetical protein [Methanococcus maripaludis]|uniref:Uncharacterized protein n=1 Tax=Methanococcus maripaludis TaxID=39152 RepID=A0A7J9PRZ0_METMI|nr:hypothetical protein [Methanococcus maripaludis]MBA2868916.1 hypothetical protein [Methanococcus maripaludis]